MRKIIHDLRKRPEHERKTFALITTVAFTLVVGIIWSTTLPARLNSLNQASAGESVKNLKNSVTAPFTASSTAPASGTRSVPLDLGL